MELSLAQSGRSAVLVGALLPVLTVPCHDVKVQRDEHGL